VASVFDVAASILHKSGPMTAMKLQKLVYYTQAWSLVWDEMPLFRERIEAWANGPVVPELFAAHKGQFTVSSEPKGNRKNLTGEQQKTVDAVVKYYGEKTAPWLSDLTHREAPWRDARIGIAPGVRSNREITLAAMAEYYGNL
jgi:uncharacterized phage-associated protein